jgi:hypothetical protein
MLILSRAIFLLSLPAVVGASVVFGELEEFIRVE